MGVATLFSRALVGASAPEVIVEANLANGLPTFTIVGLPEAEVREARDRVRAAITNAGFEFPSKRITVNLAPADLPKEGGRFDLPIALGILAASDQIPSATLSDYEFSGELSLTGELRPIRGGLAMVAHAAKTSRAFVLPVESATEAALIRSVTVLSAPNLLAVCAHLDGQQPLTVALSPELADVAAPRSPFDLSDVKGQIRVKRALEVAAAGGHSVLMIGPPGTGKSMLAQRFADLLPPMTDQEAIESCIIRSLGSRGLAPGSWRSRPFRSPHHSASVASLVGGGSSPRPGEISLAHHGVLFLDELPEFDRRALEALREPLENGRIHISRAAHQAEYAARFILIAAMNPCACGNLGHPTRSCRCTAEKIARYQARISGPLLDRIDIRIEVPSLSEQDLLGASAAETSATVRERVIAARAVQTGRQGRANAALTPKAVERHCTVDPAGESLLRNAINRLALSARSYHRILRLARSIADLADQPSIQAAHIAEAIQYRRSLGEAN